MRLDLAGYLPPTIPLVLVLADGDSFVTAPYLALGYTNYDVMCIGAAGGRGSGTYDPGSPYTYYSGGAGGGGGSHRIQGLLDALPGSNAVVLGVPGTDRDPAELGDFGAMLDGSDGGAASFGGTICRASGGKGGTKVTGFSTTTRTGDGGEGGIGGSTTAGGAANGGVGADIDGSPVDIPVAATTGGWDGTIGGGGGGGAGGYGSTSTNPIRSASNASKGSYNAGDQSVNGPAGTTTLFDHPDTATNLTNVTPGYGGGAKATPLNGLATVFGAKTRNVFTGEPVPGSGIGLVIVRLTLED